MAARPHSFSTLFISLSTNLERRFISTGVIVIEHHQRHCSFTSIVAPQLSVGEAKWWALVGCDVWLSVHALREALRIGPSNLAGRCARVHDFHPLPGRRLNMASARGRHDLVQPQIHLDSPC
jgi:hypothetical protein